MPLLLPINDGDGSRFAVGFADGLLFAGSVGFGVSDEVMVAVGDLWHGLSSERSLVAVVAAAVVVVEVAVVAVAADALAVDDDKQLKNK
jgi:hypothetical protein